MKTSDLEPSTVPGYNQASWPSRLTYSWLTRLLHVGIKRPLENKDLPDLPESVSAKNLHEKFQENLRKCKGSVRKALFATMGRSWLLVSAFKVFKDFTRFFVYFYCIKCILELLEKPEIAYGKVFLHIGMIFVSQLLGNFLLTQYFSVVANTGISAAAVLTCAIFQKSIDQTLESRSKFPTGTLINMCAGDTYRLELLASWFHFAWTSVIQFIVVVFFLQRNLGWLSILGFVPFLIFIPVQGLLMRRIHHFRRQIVSTTDNRLNEINNCINGIRVIKFFAWEKYFYKRILDKRTQELKLLKFERYLKAVATALLSSCPVFALVTTMLIYYFANGKETVFGKNVGAIYASISAFEVVTLIFLLFPIILSMIIDAQISLNRIEEFLNQPENTYVPEITQDSGIRIENATFSWPTAAEGTESFSLKNIDLQVARGELLMVVGPVGGGKSSLVSAIVGEMPLISGDLRLQTSKLGLCTQQAWIQNMTLRNNVLFGKDFDPVAYEQALHASCLEHDLRMFPDGDQTEIGEKGANLSGGQKQRVSLARAIYFGADVVLLDDPLSALDAHVGKDVFERCVLGAFAGKTRLLISHQLQFCKAADRIVYIDDGQIKEIGTFDELMQSENSLFKVLYSKHLQSFSKIQNANENEFSDHILIKKSFSVEISDDSSSTLKKVTFKANKKQHTKLFDSNGNAGVSFSTFKYYFSQGISILPIVLLFICLCLSRFFLQCGTFWINVWIDDKFSMQNEKFYYISYAALPGLVFLFCTLYAIGVFHATIKSSLNIHMNVIQSLLNASSSFFDQNPSGQIFDRMSKDIEALDVALPDTLVPTLNSVITILVVFTLMVVTYPLLLIVLIICAIVFFSLQRCYRCSARSFKRLSASTRGNVLSFLSDSISGAVVIKSQGRRDLFVAKMTQKYDNYNKTIHLLNESQRWLASRVDFMGSIMLVLATVGGIFYERMFSKDLSSLGNNIGFILTCSVSIVEILYWCIIQSVDVDINLTSVERLEYYHKSISHESEHVYHVDAPSKRATLSMEKVHIEESNSIDELIDERSPAIEFSNVWLKYRPDLPFILKGINMRIAPGQKIGLVGRTGSGKSTIIQALFRFVDVHDDEQSVVRVFGCDVREMPLRSLRTLLTVIPQDPTLFGGTIRTNIDPLGERTDAQIWEALKGAHLATHFSTLDDGIEAGGSNLSQGQRQLVCLARALVRKSRILVLDEATASVDVDADAKIQAAIAENCRDVTVVTIAHRLETVMKTDNVFVLSDGAVVESGNPLELIRDSNSLFCRMARSH